MRIWELSLIVINFGMLFWVVIANKKDWRGTFVPITAAFGLVLAQLILEGGRWQLIPAYLTPFILTAYFFLGKRKESGRSRFAVMVQAVLLTLYLFVSIALPALLPVFSFDKPTGSYPVGTTVFHWVDEQRREPYSENPEDRRELMVQIWYPAVEDSGIKQGTYIKNAAKMSEAISSMINFPGFALSHLGLVKTHALPEAALSGSESRYPVLVFSHGMLGFRNHNTFQVEELASHGYIVVGIDHVYDAAATVFPDGRLAVSKIDNNLSGYSKMDAHMPLWTGDAAFVLDQIEKLNRSDSTGRFTGKIDTQRIGMFGHSYGGGAAAQMLLKDPRVKAAIGMDGGMYGTPVSEQGIGKPFFLMFSEETISKINVSYDEFIKQTEGKAGIGRQEFEAPRKEYMRRTGNALAGGGLSILIPRTMHTSYTDFTLYSPLLSTPLLGGRGEDPRRIHRIVNEFSLAFFDRYLKGTDDSRLRALAAKYPEVNYKVNQ